ncbi:zinc ABC transporter substrate-binding protein, partial [bacterium]|nr:zinc ABC transporter substrate-binding protein [bacterium]
RIGGSAIRTNVLIQGGQDPHTFEPTPSQMAALSKADLFVTVGMPFEKVLVNKLADNLGKSLTIVPTEQPIDAVQKSCEGACDHCQPDADQRDDPHIWLSPTLLIEQARIITDALIKIDSTHAETYRKNLVALEDEIRTLDKKICEALAPFEGQAFYVFHPAFGHFARSYNLIQKPVETGGKSPTPKQLNDLITRAKADSVRIIFVQPQFDPTAAEKIAKSIGGVVVPLDPLARDVLQNLEEMADQIINALSVQSSTNI